MLGKLGNVGWVCLNLLSSCPGRIWARRVTFETWDPWNNWRLTIDQPYDEDYDYDHDGGKVTSRLWYQGSFELLQCLLSFLRKFSLMCRFCWSLSVEQNCVFFLLEQNAFWKIGRLDKYSDRGWPGKCEYRAPWIYFLFFHIRRNAFVGTLSFLLLIKTEIRNPKYSEKSVQQ